MRFRTYQQVELNKQFLIMLLPLFLNLMLMFAGLYLNLLLITLVATSAVCDCVVRGNKQSHQQMVRRQGHERWQPQCHPCMHKIPQRCARLRYA
jgi:cell division septal protein FtsQ